MNKEQEIRARALDAIIALISALPEKEAIALLNNCEELAADEVIIVMAERFAKYITG